MALEPVNDERSLANLEHPVGPSFGQVSIENSSDVHFGDKNFYNGPVVIKQQIVYANDSDKVTNNDDSKKGFLWLQNVSKHKSVEIGIFVVVVILFVVVLTVVLVLKHAPTQKPSALLSNEPNNLVNPIKYDSDILKEAKLKNKVRLVTRVQWLAQPPSDTTTPLATPAPYVIIHHTATENCSSQAQCVLHVRQIQTYHIESKGWYDIGYNFLVGGDGAAYEARGWTVEGAHTLAWNDKSIGIAFIGTFIKTVPPDIQIAACLKLIEEGVNLGYISKEYKILAARQLSGTESPGAALYEKMKNWTHWSNEI